MIDGDQLMWSYVGVNRRRGKGKGKWKEKKTNKWQKFYIYDNDTLKQYHFEPSWHLLMFTFGERPIANEAQQYEENGKRK